MLTYHLPHQVKENKGKLILYGTGEIAEQYLNELRDLNLLDQVVFFINTYPVRDEYKGKPIYSPEQVDKMIDKNDYTYIICSFVAIDVIANTLLSLGISINNVVYPVIPNNEVASYPIFNKQIQSICYYPFETEKAIKKDIVQRLEWYLPNLSSLSVYLPQIIDEANNSFNKERENNLEEADVILVWDQNRLKDDLIMKHKHKVACVDPVVSKSKEYDIYRKLYYWTLSIDKKNLYEQQSKEKFADMLNKNKDKKKGFVFGTGPSLELASNFEYRTDSFKIVCNSIVKNKVLLEHIKPDVLVFADPVFHFSFCAYAQEFRREAIEVIRSSDIYCIIPDFCVPLLTAHFPEIEDKLIGIPSHSSTYNIPSTKASVVKATDNILTLLMLPIASAVSEEIYILGCDGRRKEENYFWQHSKSSQFDGLMDTVFKAHPSFFNDRSYEGYYEIHCEVLKSLIEFGESKNKRYYSLTPSYIPVLEERMVNAIHD